MIIECDELHRYKLNGVRVPGTTEVISGLGLIDTRWYTDEHRARGSAVHAAVQYHLEGSLDWDSVDPRITGHVTAALRLIDDLKLEAIRIEHAIASERYQFCGMADFDGLIQGEPAVIDWKSGAIVTTTGLQLSGYDICLREMFTDTRRRRIAAQLRPDGTYRIQDMKSYKDEARFLSALDLYRTFVFKEGRINGPGPGHDYSAAA